MNIFDTSNSGPVGGAGLIISALGLLVSLGGFWITWKQLKKTKNSALAASDAVRDLRKTLAYFDSLGEIYRAIATANEITRHLIGRNYEFAYSGYIDLRRSLIKIVELSDDIKQVDSEELKSHIAHAATVSDFLIKNTENPDKINPAKLIPKAQILLDTLYRLEIHSKRSAK